MESGKITQSEALDQFDLSASTLRRARRSGAIGAEQEPDGRQAWLYDVADLERLYERRDPDPIHDPGQSEDDRGQVTAVMTTVTDTADIEARIYLEYVERDLEQRTAERDRARSDHEHEKGERERLERETIQLRAELDAARTIAGDRADRIEKLEADAAERTRKLDETGQKLDEYAQNLTRRYRRTVRRAEKAAGASGSEQ